MAARLVRALHEAASIVSDALGVAADELEAIQTSTRSGQDEDLDDQADDPMAELWKDVAAQRPEFGTLTPDPGEIPDLLLAARERVGPDLANRIDAALPDVELPESPFPPNSSAPDTLRTAADGLWRILTMGHGLAIGYHNLSVRPPEDEDTARFVDEVSSCLGKLELNEFASTKDALMTCITLDSQLRSFAPALLTTQEQWRPLAPAPDSRWSALLDSFLAAVNDYGQTLSPPFSMGAPPIGTKSREAQREHHLELNECVRIDGKEDNNDVVLWPVWCWGAIASKTKRVDQPARVVLGPWS
ncbi:hypothetical protein [Actinokineospora diospyrosa]|uniref:hypothetical protein n=1 Tax=Actinokineospora diospyrosa TaxID=103728 RepID=UPI0020A42708|nr:hypothetical protein [Actinokineospora diospyrosa]